ncbi:pseudouridine synthase [Butyrivibrio sp. MC2013]|uniref:pseudouridine synthase n=1 Tax=Butyrivibrio sp. MC2013 TaxID=1280686 RepID=UPI000405E1C8|nr:pseudouridine synthase [Butyrivibrio sp. MC2013]
MAEEIRLNKYIAMCGICSRRDADKLIASGKVTINDMTADPGSKVTGKDTVKVNGKTVKPATVKKVYAYYKPEGVVCTERDDHAERKVIDELHLPERVTYAGRLDMNSTGLLILTNDGDLINAMMKGSKGHEKEYSVHVDKEVNGSFLRQMANGVYLEELDVTTRKCFVTKTGAKSFRITLTQGLNRQIRRMCKALGYNVRSLNRTRVVNIKIGDMKPGQVREITGREKAILYEKCGLKYNK